MFRINYRILHQAFVQETQQETSDDMSV